MTGFKNFILRGNLIEIAVAFIIATSFATVVTAFTNWLTSLLPESADEVFSSAEPFGAFMNAVIAFVILAAIVYFFVVVPYTAAREKFFPSPEPGTPEDIKLLQEIRDLLASGGKSPISPPTPQG